MKTPSARTQRFLGEFGNRLQRAFQLWTTLLICLALPACASGRSLKADSQETSSEQTAQQPKAPDSDKAQAPRPRAASDPDKFALIVAGVGGEESYTKKFTTLATKLNEVLTGQLNFDPQKTTLLTEGIAGDPENAVAPPEANASRRSTAEEVRKAFNSIKDASKPGNLVLIVLIGHGSVDGQQAKFNLIGPDLSAKDYAQMLSAMPGRRIVFVNCASSSGEFVKPLSGDNRVIVTATRSGNEQNATIFAEHFVAALTGGAADADKNGRLSVLEVFNYATKLTADWYKQKNRLATEHALIDDNGDGVGHEEAAGGDGSMARVVYLDSKPIIEAGGDKELARLIAERQRLEEAVEKLKAKKESMKPEEYDAELEKLLVDLAKVNQEIKTRQK